MTEEQDYVVGSKEHADAIQRAIDGRNDMVHAAFQYQCALCRSVEWIYLGVGVEGPEQLREKGLCIPSPFIGPRCLLCNGETSHIRFQQDKRFAPVDAPPQARFYRVPAAGLDMRYFYRSSCYCGELAPARAAAPRDEPPGGWNHSPRAG